MPLDRDSAFLAALGASIAAHIVGAGVAAFVRPELAHAAVVLRDGPVELEWIDLAPAPSPVPEPAPSDTPPEPASEAAPVTAAVAQALAVSAASVPTPPGGVDTVQPGLPEPTHTPEHGVLPPGSLDPRSVALGAIDVARHQVAPQAQPVAEDPRARFRRAESTLDAHLSAQAATRPAVSERPRPQVRRQPDGSYLYAGHAFRARITTDGQVVFSDTSPMRYNGGGDIEDSASLSFGFDLTDAAYRRRGHDPYQAEREWFMRETETMREELQDAARARERTQLARQMAGRVQHVWDTVERTEESRRRRIFSLWDGCAEGDADGDAARRAILGWVRSHLPAGSASAFTPAELAAMNGRRQSSAAFAPY